MPEKKWSSGKGGIDDFRPGNMSISSDSGVVMSVFVARLSIVMKPSSFGPREVGTG